MEIKKDIYKNEYNTYEVSDSQIVSIHNKSGARITTWLTPENKEAIFNAFGITPEMKVEEQLPIR